LYALKKVSSEPHVLELHAAFKHGDRPCLLFKWAQGGSLSELMEMNPYELRLSGTQLYEWIVLQMTGLAEGLCGMHDAHDDLSRWCIDGKEDFYGIHGDVKPDNILRFTDRDPAGRLVLSDFGLTRFHTKASRSHRRGNGPVSPTYASPEHNDYICGVSRRSDVWALGCVYTEMLTWAIQGPEAHKLYECARLSEDDVGRQKGTWHMDRFFGIDFSERDLSGALGRRFLKKAVIDVRFLPIPSLIKLIRDSSQQAHWTIVHSNKQGYG
jgi:serine/threonine protein kinase